MILVIIPCDLCDAQAGIGMDYTQAQANVIDQGGRVFGSVLNVCVTCSEHTR